MRGEDVGPFGHDHFPFGSPPHARGRPPMKRIPYGGSGITPACAGKTATAVLVRTGPGDHPRMRGEDCGGRLAGTVVRGSPPHARGRPSKISAISTRSGITPACAGKTADDQRVEVALGDHPRMRGEDANTNKSDAAFTGSPPHARGRPHYNPRLALSGRITPACAGKTIAFLEGLSAKTDHPRMRGEDG